MLVYDPEKIKSLRKAKDWNQAELARRAGLSQPSVWALEHGKTKFVKVGTLDAIARALGVPMKELLAARPKGKAGQGWDEEAQALYEALDDGNKAAMIAVAQTLLNSQKRR